MTKLITLYTDYTRRLDDVKLAMVKANELKKQIAEAEGISQPGNDTTAVLWAAASRGLSLKGTGKCKN